MKGKIINKMMIMAQCIVHKKIIKTKITKEAVQRVTLTINKYQQQITFIINLMRKILPHNHQAFSRLIHVNIVQNY